MSPKSKGITSIRWTGTNGEEVAEFVGFDGAQLVAEAFPVVVAGEKLEDRPPPPVRLEIFRHLVHEWEVVPVGHYIVKDDQGHAHAVASDLFESLLA